MTIYVSAEAYWRIFLLYFVLKTLAKKVLAWFEDKKQQISYANSGFAITPTTP